MNSRTCPRAPQRPPAIGTAIATTTNFREGRCLSGDNSRRPAAASATQDPVPVGLILAGLVIGPHGLEFVGPNHPIAALSVDASPSCSSVHCNRITRTSPKTAVPALNPKNMLIVAR